MEAAIGHNSQAARNNDWIAVYRNLRTHPIIGFLNPDGTRRKAAKVCQSMAWIDLCMEANWKDRHENNNGQMVLVERGQLQGGRNWLAQRWGWTENQVRWFLKKLQDEGMLVIERPKIEKKSHSNHTVTTTEGTTKQVAKSTRFVNVITICNYNTYQTVSEISDLLDDQANHQTNNQTTTKQPPHSNKETNKQDKLHPASTELVAARGMQDSLTGGLNGATALIVEKLAKWVNPIMPDYRTARGWLENSIKMYGATVVRDSFAEVDAKVLQGDVIGRPIPLLTKICAQKAAQKPAKTAQKHRKPNPWD